MALKKTKSSVNTVKSVQVKKLKKYPFYIDNDDNDDDQYEDLSIIIAGKLHNCESYSITRYANEKESVNFSFEADASTYTCGFLELGDLSTDAVSNNKSNIINLSNLLDEIVTCSKGYTLFMNTVNKGDCLKIEKALTISKYWTKVKTYINPGTKNMLTLWVSNNK